MSKKSDDGYLGIEFYLKMILFLIVAILFIIVIIGYITLKFWSYKSEWVKNNPKLVNLPDFSNKYDLIVPCSMWGIIGGAVILICAQISDILSNSSMTVLLIVGLICIGPFPIKIIDPDMYQQIDKFVFWFSYGLFMVSGFFIGFYLWEAKNFPQELVLIGLIIGVVAGVIFQRSFDYDIGQNRIQKPQSHIDVFKDIQEGIGVHLSSLTGDLGKDPIKIPSIVKSKCKKSVKGKSLVYQGGLMILDSIPPLLDTGNRPECQLCKNEIRGDIYFQCVQCDKFICLSDYNVKKHANFTKCINCGGDLAKFPSTCEGCKLDFNSNRNLNANNPSNCPLCSYPLKAFEHLDKRESTKKNENKTDVIKRIVLKDKNDVIERPTWHQYKEYYLRKIKEYPEDYDSYITLGHIFFKIEKYKEAEEIYRLILKRLDLTNSKKGEVLLNLANSMIIQNKKNESLEILKQIILIEPTNEGALKLIQKLTNLIV